MSWFPLAEADLIIRPMTTADEDIAIMARWLTDGRVLMYWDGRDKPSGVDRVREKYGPRIERGDPMPCLVEWQGRPVGFLQFYPLPESDRELYGCDTKLKVYGIDQFIGEPDCWGQGLGTRMVRLLLSHLFEHLQVERVVLDPQVQNARAIRTYEKCGFRPISVLPGKELHEGQWRDALHMAITRERYLALGGLHMTGRLELESERLLLRPFTQDDWPAVQQYAADEEALRYQVWGPNTPEQTQAYVAGRVAEARKLDPDYYAFAICLRETGEMVGSIDLFFDSRAWKNAEVGYILARRFWSQGIATEAAFLVLEFAFRRLGLQRIYATCDPENVGSYQVMEKVGMKREGLMRHDRLGKDGWRNSYLYAIIRSDWAGRQN